MAQLSYGYLAFSKEAMRGIYDDFDLRNAYVKVHTTESIPLDRMDLYFQSPKNPVVQDRIEDMEYYTRGMVQGAFTVNEVRSQLGYEQEIKQRVLCAYCGGPPQDEDFCKNCGGPQKEIT